MEKTTITTAACHGGGGGDPFLLLPKDSLIQILVGLPVVSLLRCKSVCKSWRDLIQTSFFIDLHTTFNSSSSSNFGTFISRTKNMSGENVIFMLSEYEGTTGSEYGDGYRCTDGSWNKFTTGGGDGSLHKFTGGDDDKDDQELFKMDDDDDDEDDDDNDDQLLLKVDNLELPAGYELTCGKVIAGSCNGLICLYDSKLRDVSLWNPATRQFRILPKSITIEIDGDCLHHRLFAFGFDDETKDYKVLLITKLTNVGPDGIIQWPPKISCRAQVYSLSTDSWRLLEGINSLPGIPCFEHHGLYMNGSCFFIASVYHRETNTDSKFINSFDFTKEIFTTMQLPDDDHRRHLFLCLGGEKMALFTTLRKRPSDEYDSDASNDSHGYDDCDIWVLNEHGSVNKEIWTKLHSFQIGNSRTVQPRGISNNGKFALLETTETSYSTRIQLYNLVTKEEKMGIHFCESMSNIYVYKPSLVSIIGGNGAAAAPDGYRMIGGAM